MGKTVGLFTPYERRILGALCDALLPPTPLLSETPEALGLVDRVERHLAYCPKNIRGTFRLALWLVEWGALLRRGSRFTRLAAGERERSMEGWKKSRLYGRRLLFKLLEASCLAVYYGIPEISKKLGYETPAVKKARPLAPHTENPDRDLFVEADVCVVGSGAGGAVVAKELAEKGRSVVLIEEGPYAGGPDFGRDAVEIVERLYHGGGTQMTVGLPCILLPTGRAVGGTTVINSGTCFRAPDRVLEHWQNAFGLKGLTSEALAPYFERVEKYLHVAPVTEETLGNNAKIFRRGLEAMGLKGFPLPRNAEGCEGSGMCCFGCPTEAKQAMHVSYVPRAVEKGARLFARCRVEQVIPKLSHGGEVIGRFLDAHEKPGKRLHVSAKVIVLAAGTLKTPYLLRKNRIALHNRHVGRHLNIHPTGKIIGIFDESVRAWEGVPQGYGYDGLHSEGILFEGAFTPPSLGAVNLSLPAREHKAAMEHYDRVASFGFLISDQSRGWIRWLPNGDPIIYYSIHRRELDRYLKGIRFLCEVYLAAGAKKIFTGLRTLPILTQETGLKDFDAARVKRTDLEISAFHPLGTCRMSADPADGVVDENGEVHGMKNLFIADGSIFPSSMGVNPQETIMAFANRIADYIHAHRLSALQTISRIS